jgi:hypothetical protein
MKPIKPPKSNAPAGKMVAKLEFLVPQILFIKCFIATPKLMVIACLPRPNIAMRGIALFGIVIAQLMFVKNHRFGVQF